MRGCGPLAFQFTTFSISEHFHKLLNNLFFYCTIVMENNWEGFFLPWFHHNSGSKVLATWFERGNKAISLLGLSPHILCFLPFSGFIPRKAETQFPAVKEIHSRSSVLFHSASYCLYFKG